METWSLLLSLVGLILGLISAWPTLNEWFGRLRAANSQRSTKTKKDAQIHFTLATSDFFYFVAFAARNGIVGFGLLWIALSLTGAPPKYHWLELTIPVVHWFACLLGGSLLGSVIGSAMVIMRRKARASDTNC